jgi:hypothetical protein
VARPMLKLIIGIWIYLCGISGAVITGAMIAQVLSAYPPSHIESYGPIVPAVARSWSAWLPNAPALLWLCAVMSAGVGLYLWRSRRPLESRLFAAAVIAALNLFGAMFCATALLAAYFYLPRIANLA